MALRVTCLPYSRCMYSCACGLHLCARGRAYGWQRKYMEINASRCSLCTSNTALLLAPRRSDRPCTRGDQRLMRQPMHKRTRQTHEYWYGSGERRRQERGCLHALNSRLKTSWSGGGRCRCVSKGLWCIKGAEYVVKSWKGSWQVLFSLRSLECEIGSIDVVSKSLIWIQMSTKWCIMSEFLPTNLRLKAVFTDL